MESINEVEDKATCYCSLTNIGEQQKVDAPRTAVTLMDLIAIV
jgi:hypothetical protein